MESYLELLFNHYGAWHLGSIVYPLELMQVWSNINILNDLQGAWQNFVATGQVWAFGIGFFLGYLLNKLMSY